MNRVAASLVAIVLLTAPVAAQGDVARGETAFRKCQSCHAVGENARNRVGPVLNGVVGRLAASAPDYNYSNPMKEAAAAGLVWTPETLHQFLGKPRDFIKGTKMAFAGIGDPAEVDDIVAYLATFSPPAATAAEPAQ